MEAQTVREDFASTNGSVRAAVVSGNTLYIGGWFSRVGPSTGGGVPLGVASGSPVGGFPKIAGSVATVVPDGTGGWYVGGTFTAVGGVARSNLAHVLPDLSVASWDPNANGGVNALAVSGTTVYVGGGFTEVGGEVRNYLAALDASSGLATVWNPDPDGGVQCLAANGTAVFVSGDFLAIGGQSRNTLAALDATTGLATAWDPNPNFSVRTLAVSGTAVLAGGYFSTIGGQTRNYLAALDATSGLATGWDPNPNESVAALAVDGTTVYAGGEFSMVGGQARDALAALDSGTGLATAWNPTVGGYVTAIAVSGSTVLAGGGSGTVDGQTTDFIVALDSSAGLGIWSAIPNAPPNALAASGSIAYAGGPFTMIGGQPRKNLAAVNVVTGQVTSWNPDVKNVVQGIEGPARVEAIAVDGSTIYVGGMFTVVGDTLAGGAVRNNIAALDATTGLPSAWNPNASGGNGGVGGPPSVAALTVSGSVVYAGGRFTQIGGQTRNFIAALEAATGLATVWNPSANDSVSTLTIDGSTVYSAGTFNRIGGQTRGGVAALDATAVDSTTGIVTAWDPNVYPPSIPSQWENGVPLQAYGPVRAVAVAGPTVFLGGRFDVVGGPGGPWRYGLAAVDAATGADTGWFPSPLPGLAGYSFISDLVVSGPTVYVGGAFGPIGGEWRNNIAALDAITGFATPWDPNADGAVLTLARGGTSVYAGGDFLSIGGKLQNGLAAMGDATTSVPGETWTGVRDPADFAPSPNPSLGDLAIAFTLPDALPAKFELLDLAGRRLLARDVGTFGPGSHIVTLARGSSLAPGVYLLRFERGGRSRTKRVAVIR